MSILFWRGRVSKAEFRRQYVAAVRERLPDNPCEEPADDKLCVKVSGFPQHSVVTQRLDNAYFEFRKDPSQRAEIFERSLAALEGFGKPLVVERARVLPMLKNRRWLTDAYEGGRVPERDSLDELQHEAINEELILTYVIMTPSFKYLRRGEIAEAGIAPSEIRELALANLRAKVSERAFIKCESVWMLNVGGNFEATMLLEESIFSDERFSGADTVLVAVPDRNSILMSVDTSARGVWTLASFAAALARSETYPISPQIFRRAGSAFESLDPALEDPEHPIPSIDVYDVYLELEKHGPWVGMVLGSPLDDSPRSVYRLFRKLESYLVALGCDGSPAKKAVPENERPRIHVSIHPDSHPDVLEILHGMTAVVRDRGALLRFEGVSQ